MKYRKAVKCIEQGETADLPAGSLPIQMENILGGDYLTYLEPVKEDEE